MYGYTNFDSREQLVDVLDSLGYETWKRELSAILAEGSRRSLWLQAGGERGEKPLGTQSLDGPQRAGRKRQFFLYEHPPLND